MLNITNIPAPRVNIIDERTGLISREWYRFFLNLFTLVGQGNNQTSLDDLQVGPPAQQINVLVSGGGSDVAPPPTPPVSVADYQALLPPTIMAAIADYAALMPPVLPQTTDGTVTSVDVSGGTTGLTFSGGPITTSGTITMAGTLAVANGGTGSTTLTGAGIVTLTDSQVITGQKNFTSYSCTYAGTTYATVNAYFGENASYATIGGVNGVVLASGGTYPGTARYVGDSTAFRPYANATYSSGTLAQRWTTVYSQDLDLSGTVTAGTWNGSTIGTAYGGTGATSLTGAGIVITTGTQTISGQKNFTSYSNTYAGTTYATTNAYFGESSSFAVVGGVNGVVFAYGATYPGTAVAVAASNSLRPYADNSISSGIGAQRWTEVYAVNGTINTSDGTEKQQVRELSESEQRVAQRVKKLIRAFKWNDAVAAKGDGARIHVGVIAQDVQAAFAAEGLDASQYGLFCSDTWTTLDGTSQTRLGVRYDELLAFVIAAL